MKTVRIFLFSLGDIGAERMKRLGEFSRACKPSLDGSLNGSITALCDEIFVGIPLIHRATRMPCNLPRGYYPAGLWVRRTEEKKEILPLLGELCAELQVRLTLGPDETAEAVVATSKSADGRGAQLSSRAPPKQRLL